MDLGVLVASRLNMSQQRALAARRKSCIFGYIRHSMASRSKEGNLLLHSALVQPHLEHCVEFCTPQYKKDVTILESTQRRATGLVKGLEYMSCEKRLRTLVLSSWEKKKG